MQRREAFLCFNGWAGYHETPILVVGETASRYRITPPDGVQSVKLAGRARYVRAGETALVPKTAVRFPKPSEDERKVINAELFHDHLFRQHSTRIRD